VLFLFVGNLVIKPTTTPLLVRFGFRAVLIGASIGAALSMALSALITDTTPIAVLIVLMLFSGVTRSIGFTGYNTIAFADVPSAQMTDANTLSSTIQQVAAGFGVAVGAVALRAGQPIAAAFGAKHDVLAPYQVAFVIVAMLTVIATVEAIWLSRSAGDNIRPTRRRARSDGAAAS
jgi:MFS family permease